ncbi:hypothetical protein CWI75_04290 [Kineobactrum sediminis]|uniref:DUF2946 domain-containing protein n=1 Tax=Kineobactrum sediminis TaxID=1905677 RepID=A0A2N5Y5B6_9GAMM|nr:hypothetical protein [Kineobactrum sediminis]PLW83578.1 hypothetical protein CWI75_04290 [Kineobactrum sediminis]
MALHPSRLTARSRRFARTLALLALLCVTGLQVLETSHTHSTGDAVAECLLCKTSAPLPLASALPLLVLLCLAFLLLPVWLAPHQASHYLPHPIRGPPHYS